MKNLLIVLGKRVRELRTAKAWSQENFADICGLHRTYVGQIERGEKNISFGNLIKLSAVLGVTLSELLSRLEDGGPLDRTESKRKPEANDRSTNSERRMLEIQKLVKRLGHQRTALDRTILTLEQLTVNGRTEVRARYRQRRGS